MPESRGTRHPGCSRRQGHSGHAGTASDARGATEEIMAQSPRAVWRRSGPAYSSLVPSTRALCSNAPCPRSSMHSLRNAPSGAEQGKHTLQNGVDVLAVGAALSGRAGTGQNALNEPAPLIPGMRLIHVPSH